MKLETQPFVNKGIILQKKTTILIIVIIIILLIIIKIIIIVIVIVLRSYIECDIHAHNIYIILYFYNKMD